MPSSTNNNEKQERRAVTPRQTMRGHTDNVKGLVHLPGGRRIITCSLDGSLRLWDLESGAQIGEDWRDEGEKTAAVYKMALSPCGQTVVSGSGNGKMKLWDVETGKVVQKWTGHTENLLSVCWSVDGNRVVSGSWDGIAGVSDINTGKRILKIKTGHKYVLAVITLKHEYFVQSLAWTSDAKKLITASCGPIRIFDTATWQQIAILEGHTSYVNAITLSWNNCLLASASDDNTVRLWSLDTNLPVGPPLQHKDKVECTGFSADGKLLVTGGREKNAYTWDIHAILKQACLEGLLPTGTNIAPNDRLEPKTSQSEPRIERTPRSSLSDKSFLEVDATRYHDEFGGVDVFSPRFFDGMEVNDDDDDDSSPTGGAHPHSSASAFHARLTSLLHRFRVRPDNVDANELSQPPTLLGLHPRVLFARLSSLIHRSPPENDAPNELQQPFTPSRLRLHALLARQSSLPPRSRLNTGEETDPHPTVPSGSCPDTLMDLLSSLIRSQPHTIEEIEPSPRATRLHVVEVAPMRDREVLFVAPRVQSHRHPQPAGTAAPGARPVHSQPIRLLGHIGLFLCCVCDHQHADGNAQPTQQPQGQSQG